MPHRRRCHALPESARPEGPATHPVVPAAWRRSPRRCAAPGPPHDRSTHAAQRTRTGSPRRPSSLSEQRVSRPRAEQAGSGCTSRTSAAPPGEDATRRAHLPQHPATSPASPGWPLPLCPGSRQRTHVRSGSLRLSHSGVLEGSTITHPHDSSVAIPTGRARSRSRWRARAHRQGRSRRPGGCSRPSRRRGRCSGCSPGAGASWWR